MKESNFAPTLIGRVYRPLPPSPTSPTPLESFMYWHAGCVCVCVRMTVRVCLSSEEALEWASSEPCSLR